MPGDSNGSWPARIPREVVAASASIEVYHLFSKFDWLFGSEDVELVDICW